MEYRSFAPDLQIRKSGDGRTVFGIVVPYNVPMKITSNLTEQFARGVANAQLSAARRVKFSREHIILGGDLIGAGAMLRDDAAGLYGEFRVSKTPKGEETLTLLEDGALEELSVGFEALQNRTLRGGIVERVKARIFEVAVVLEGAYGQHAIAAGVRAAGAPELERIEIRRGTPVLQTPNLDNVGVLLSALPALLPEPASR